MLSRDAILKAIETGEISISPFDENNLNSVSYDMELSNILKVYKPLDYNGTMKFIDTNDIRKEDFSIKIPECGYILEPGKLYLGHTVEKVASSKYIPCISGRSTYARCGIQVHQTAFFANPGHEFQWVLEISVVVPVIIYPGIKISQMYFEPIDGDIKEKDLYDGKYKKNNLSTGISE